MHVAMIASAAIAPPVGIPNRAQESLLEQAFSRAAGAPLVTGNRVVLLRDATANYPAWLSAIRAARKTVLLESYIFDDDVVGLEFAAALAERAKSGVRVRVIRDWVGTFASARRGLFGRLRGAGVDVRRFNPPAWDSPFGVLRRDHRKMIAVDGEVAFVSGVCIGRRWLGDPRRGLDPWRDTGIEVRGPAVAHVERAFAHVWAATGPPFARRRVIGSVLDPAGGRRVAAGGGGRSEFDPAAPTRAAHRRRRVQ
jgi:cardiolipin synthase A/B